MIKDEYIVLFFTEDQVNILELLYETTWTILFYPDGEIARLTRWYESGRTILYPSIDKVPRDQQSILEDTQLRWKQKRIRKLSRNSVLSPTRNLSSRVTQELPL
jgi:hypothetical protein